MQHIFNTQSLHAKYTEYESHYSVYYNGNIIADVCVSGQFIRFVNVGVMVYIDVIAEIKTIMDTISKQYKQLHPEQPA